MTSSQRDPRPIIVVGVDGSSMSATALRWAVREATERHGSVRVVVVRYAPEMAPATSMAILPRGERHPQRGDGIASREWLENAAARARAGIPGAAPVRVEEVVGDPGEKLCAAAADADLLVVGAHGYGPLAEVFLGSVASSCLRHALCPVVVLSPKASERYDELHGSPV